jgi:hypothetical protein
MGILLSKWGIPPIDGSKSSTYDALEWNLGFTRRLCMAERGIIGTPPSSGTAGSVKAELESWRENALKEYTSVTASAAAEGTKLKADAKHVFAEAKEHPKTTLISLAGAALVVGDIATRGKLHESGFKFLDEVKQIPFGKYLGRGEEALGDMYASFSRATREEQGLFGRRGLASEKYTTDIDAFLKGKGPPKSFGLDGFQDNEVRLTVNSDAGVKATDVELKLLQARGTILNQNLAAADRDLRDLSEEAKQLKALATSSAKDIRVSSGGRPSKMLEGVRSAEHELKSAQSETGAGRDLRIKTAEENLAAAKKAAEQRLLEIEGNDGNSGLIGRIKGIGGELKEKQTQDAAQTQTLLGHAMTYVKELTTNVESRVKALTADTPAGGTPKHITQADLQSAVRTEPTADEAKKIAEGEKLLQNKDKPVTTYLSYRERFGVDEPAPAPVVQPKPIEAPAPSVQAARGATGAARVEPSADGAAARNGRQESGGGNARPISQTIERSGGVKPLRIPTEVPAARPADRVTALAEQSGFGASTRVESVARVMPPHIDASFKAANSAEEEARAAVEAFKTAKANSTSSTADFRGAMRALGNYVAESNKYLRTETNQAARDKYTEQAVSKLEEMLPTVDKKGQFEFPERIGSNPKEKLRYITQNLDGRLRSLGENAIVAPKVPGSADFLATTQAEAAKARQVYDGFKAAEAQQPMSGNFKGTIGALQTYARSASDYMQAQLVAGKNVEADPIVQKAVADLKEMMPPGKGNVPFAFPEGTPETFSGQLSKLRQVLDNRMSGFAKQSRAIAERTKPPGS